MRTSRQQTSQRRQVVIDAIQTGPAVQKIGVNARMLEGLGLGILRYGLVLFLVGSGLSKFTELEARWIEPLMANSPFFAWIYGVTSIQGASNLIGIIELVIAAMMVVRRWWPIVAAIGSLGAALTFVFTFSFLF